MNPFDPGYWREDELRAFGFKVGRDVMVAKNCTIIGLDNTSFSNIILGDHVRIDGFSTIAAATGFLTLGSFIHIGGYCHLACAGGVTLSDFAGLSQRVSIYSASDDYSGASLTNPTIPRAFLNTQIAPVRLGRHVIVGSGSVILPGVDIGDGCAIGALTVVNRTIEAWGVYSGVPARRIKSRLRALEGLEARLLSQSR